MQTVRPYAASDRDACLALFDGNTPRFFDPSERAGFAAWLEASTQPYLLIERSGRIVACGGHTQVARLTMNTSEHTQQFYARFGFGPGIDQWDMLLQLPA